MSRGNRAKHSTGSSGVRVLYIHSNIGISGGERSLLNLWQSMDRKTYVPHLMIPRSGPLGKEAERIGVEVVHCHVPRLRPQYLISIADALMTIVGYCRRESIRLIHSYVPRNNVLSSMAGRLLGIPVIWHERNIIFGDEKDISRKLLFLPNRVICNSQAIAERFRRKGKLAEKVKVVLNGVDLESFRPRRANREIIERLRTDGRRVVGLVSNLGKRKAPEYLLDICPHVLERSPDTLFVIVGGEFGENDKGRKAGLETSAKSLGISDHVIFTGFVSNVSEIIQVFDIGVAVTEKEACSRAILEMMASGKPVVAFHTGGNAELIEHGVTGILVSFGDRKALASSVVDLLQDEQRRREMGIRARKRAEDHFDVGINAQRTQEVYSELIGSTIY